MNEKMLNVLIRGISMGSKFILFVMLAKFFSPEELGIFGLITAGIVFFVLLVGGDFYTFSNRKLLGEKRDKWAKIIVNQVIAYIPLYVIFFPLTVFIFIFDFLSWNYFSLFCMLVLIEHISQEQNRLLNIMHKQTYASLVFFLRSASWILVVLPIMYFEESLRNIETLLLSWFLGALVSAIFAGIMIKKTVGSWSGAKLDLTWILSGYKISIIFLIGTMIYRALFTLDKFWLEELSGTAAVGIYVFYMMFILGFIAFIHAGIIVFSSPKIIRAFQEEKYLHFNLLMKKFCKDLLISSILMVIGISFLMPFVLFWIDRPQYFEDYNVLYILMVAGVAMIISNHPHTYLYANKKDKFLLFTNLVSLFSFIISINILSFLEGLYNVSISTSIAFSTLCVVKYFGYIYFERRDI